MKKVTFCIIFLLMCFIGAKKGYSQLKHVQGINSIGVNYGVIKNGFSTNFVYTNYLKSNMIIKAAFIYENVSFKLSKYDAYYLNSEFHYTLTNFNYTVFINAKGGLICGYEFMSNDIIERKLKQFILGESIGLSTEILIGSKFFLNLDAEQRFFQMSKIGSMSMILKLGINYNF